MWKLSKWVHWVIALNRKQYDKLCDILQISKGDMGPPLVHCLTRTNIELHSMHLIHWKLLRRRRRLRHGAVAATMSARGGGGLGEGVGRGCTCFLAGENDL